MKITIYPTLELELDVTVFSLGHPGYLAGPPELCDPPEPAEITWDLRDDEIISAFRAWVEANWDSLERQIIDEYRAERDGG
jgi:hypothetical protein